jgi:hypothetical protein
MSRDYIGLNQMKLAPHPPYSPDLASSDFFLFGNVKGKLMGIALELHLNFLFVFGLFWRKSRGRP